METERDEFPANVKIEIVDAVHGGHWCGASLVADDIVMSAAHCGPSYINRTIAVVVGVYNRSMTAPEADRGVHFEIKEIVLHPKFDPVTAHFDIMLIKLEGTTQIEPVHVNKEKLVPYWFQNVTAVGWGALFFSNETGRWMFPEVQHRVNLPHNDSYACVNPDKFCTGGGGTGLCSGDSGGPLLVLGDTPSETVQVGIANSYAGREHCTGYNRHMFHRTSYTFPWMRRTICRLSNDPPEYLDCNAESSPSESPYESPSSPARAQFPVNASHQNESDIEPSEMNDDKQRMSSSTGCVLGSFWGLGGLVWLSFVSIH